MNAKTVLILGAHGRLGGAAVRAFAGAGWRVRAQQPVGLRPAGCKNTVAGPYFAAFSANSPLLALRNRQNLASSSYFFASTP